MARYIAPQVHTTPAGRKVHSYHVDHKRGPLMGFSTRPGGAALLVLKGTNKIQKEHTGMGAMLTAHHDGHMALTGTYTGGPSGELHLTKGRAIKAALAYIDRMDLPERPCMHHPSRPAASADGQPERCDYCLEQTRATAERLTRETAPA